MLMEKRNRQFSQALFLVLFALFSVALLASCYVYDWSDDASPALSDDATDDDDDAMDDDDDAMDDDDDAMDDDDDDNEGPTIPHADTGQPFMDCHTVVHDGEYPASTSDATCLACHAY